MSAILAPHSGQRATSDTGLDMTVLWPHAGQSQDVQAMPQAPIANARAHRAMPSAAPHRTATPTSLLIMVFSNAWSFSAMT